MRIKTFDQNGKLISEKEVKCRIPRYVQEFDDSHPLVRMSSKEHKLLNSKSESIEKLLLIERYRQILRFDYSLYLDSEDGCKILSSLNDGVYGNSGDLTAPCVEIEGISSKKDWLKHLIEYIKDTAEEKYSNLENIEIWLDYIKSESEHSWSTYNKMALENNCESDDRYEFEDSLCTCAKRYRTLLDTLQKEVYPQLKRRSKQSNRLKSILCLIPPRYSSQLKPYSFDDDKFVVKVCNSLYEINSKRRSDVYGVVLTYNFLSQVIVNSNFAFLNISPEEYHLSVNEKGVRRIEVFMSSEENAKLRTSNSPSKAVTFTKDALNEIYDDFCSKSAKDIEKDTEGDFITYFDGITIDEAKTKHWRELYFKLRKDISFKIDLLDRNQPMPFFYTLLLRHDNKYNNVIHSDDFIKDLLLINDRFHSVILTDVLGYIYQFNYIKIKAFPVKPSPSDINSVSTDDPFVWDSNIYKEYNLEESIDRALSFIAPILNSKFIEKVKKTGDLFISPEKFQTDFRNLFKKDGMPESVHRTLLRITEEYTSKKDRYPYQGFNYKLLFNIIGMLKSCYDEGTQRNIQRIFINVSKHLVDELMENREAIKEKEGWSAFRKYLAYYKSYVEKCGKESFSIANVETIKFVQNHFHVAEDVFEEEKKDKFR